MLWDFLVIHTYCFTDIMNIEGLDEFEGSLINTLGNKVRIEEKSNFKTLNLIIYESF